LKDEVAHKLLEGIRKYGLENVSTLSKWIGIPVETARYMIWHELPKYNIGVGVSINLQKIGLSRWLLEFKPVNKNYTEAIENALKSQGLMYAARMIPDNSLHSIVATPFGEDSKLREEFDSLKDSGIVESYSLDELEWARYLSFDPTFYDFRTDGWNFKWSDLERRREPLLTPYAKGGPFDVDYKDILILKELRENVPRTLSKLSKKIKLDQHNLRYHYKNHAKQAIQGYYLKYIPHETDDSHATMKFVYEIANERSLIEARTVAVSIPFTNWIVKTERQYVWTVSCPGEFVSGLLSYVNRKFVEIPGKIRLLMIDNKSVYRGPIPSQLYDENSGKWHYYPKIAVPLKRIARNAPSDDSRKS
jgi:DNA-binding Lrp family transcriptional regulator